MNRRRFAIAAAFSALLTTSAAAQDTRRSES